MMHEETIVRYLTRPNVRLLKETGKHGIRAGGFGLHLIRRLRVPVKRLRELNEMRGVGGFGPCYDLAKMVRPDIAMRNARRQFFMVTMRYSYTRLGRRIMTTDRPFRKGIYQKPRRPPMSKEYADRVFNEMFKGLID